MKPFAIRTVLALASIFAMRMLGLFMILPVFSLYAQRLDAATPTLIGIAMGVYGLTQALLQIPFGILSDHFPRKVIITIGLLIFGAGSAVAAMAHTIWGVIIGRALQGGGAVGSVIIALVADLTTEEQRTKAMAIIGLTIGFSFALAMIVGPILSAWISVAGIFWLTMVLALIAIIILHTAIPVPVQSRWHRDTELEPKQIRKVLGNWELQRLNLGVCFLHAILTASFVVIPVNLEKIAGLPGQQQWFIYLPVLILSCVTMLPLIILAEKKQHLKRVFLAAIGIVGLSQLLLLAGSISIWATGFSLWVFFTGFNLLEASLPSLVSKMAPSASKGTAMGIYSSCQFLGIFIGGGIGGWLYSGPYPEAIFLFCILLTLLWLLIAVRMQSPTYLVTQLLQVGQLTVAQAEILSAKLINIPGVAEANVFADEGIAYLKVDPKVLNQNDLNSFGVND